MIQAVLTYDLVPSADQPAYLTWARNAIGLVMQQPGLIEFRAHRNLLGAPLFRVTIEWQSMADLEKFLLGAWQPVEAELAADYQSTSRASSAGSLQAPVSPGPLGTERRLDTSQ